MQLDGHTLFLLWFWLLVGFVWVPVGWTVMRLLTPGLLVHTYFREPHFSQAEIFFCSHWPGTLLRTSIFMAACFQERYRRGRKLQGFLEMVPDWYVTASKLFVFTALGHGTLLISLMLGLLLWPE